MQFTKMVTLLLPLATIVTGSSTYENASDVSIAERGFVERDVTYYCDSQAHWLGTTNCGYVWAGIYYLEDKVKDRVLVCPGYTRCRWSCSYNSGLWLDNTFHDEIKITGRQFAAEVRDIIQHCRGGRSCSENNMNEYWFQGEKNYGREDHRIMISHTTAFNENC